MIRNSPCEVLEQLLHPLVGTIIVLFSPLCALHCEWVSDCLCVCVHALDCTSSADVPINPMFLMKCRQHAAAASAEDGCPAGFRCTFTRFALINTQVAVSNESYRISSVSWVTIWTLCFHNSVTVPSTNTCRGSDSSLLYIYFIILKKKKKIKLNEIQVGGAATLLLLVSLDRPGHQQESMRGENWERERMMLRRHVWMQWEFPSSQCSVSINAQPPSMAQSS